MPNEISMQLNR